MSTANQEQAINLAWPQDVNLLRRFVRGAKGEIWAFAAVDDDSAIYNVGSTEMVREFDDGAVRAIAVSSDEKRIAIGFDDGSLNIYTDGALKSCFAAPYREGLLRDLKFHPRYPYWLAVASEQETELINIETEETVKSESVLKDEVMTAHNGSGTRSIEFHLHSDSKVIMTTLSLDGRLCYWDVSGKPTDWCLLHCEKSRCITKEDMSEVLGADPWDRACRVSHTSLSNNIVSVLPGETFVQLRRVDGTSVEDCSGSDVEHTESIVIALVRRQQVVTSGRDGTLILWNLKLDEVCYL
jgi:WD40 repeat protein